MEMRVIYNHARLHYTENVARFDLNFYGPFILIIVVIIGWALFFRYIPPEEFVSMIGVQNSYLIAFSLAVICGFTSLTGATFYITLAALAHGGASPLVLGLIGGIGLCISDAIFFYFISKGTHVIHRHWGGLATRIMYWMDTSPQWAVPLFIFGYSAFVPIPNDIVLVTLAVGRRPFKKIAPYLFVGDIVSTLLISYLSY